MSFLFGGRGKKPEQAKADEQTLTDHSVTSSTSSSPSPSSSWSPSSSSSSSAGIYDTNMNISDVIGGARFHPGHVGPMSGMPAMNFAQDDLVFGKSVTSLLSLPLLLLFPRSASSFLLFDYNQSLRS